MTDHGVLPPDLRSLLDGPVKDIQQAAGEDAERVDRDCDWPEAPMRRLAAEGLLGLHVSRDLGGKGMGLLALAAVCESLGRGCSSLAMCYGMHCVATAVIGAKATDDQKDRYLKPIARGEHVTTLALSEAGTGAHFYLPSAELRTDDGHFVLDGAKHFVTNGGRADSYVVSTQGYGASADVGQFSCVIVDGGLEGMIWGTPWRGTGMRGNSSCSVQLKGVRIPRPNLLGETGDQIWYIFEVVAPYFLMAMAGTYLGIAGAALEIAKSDLKSRKHSHATGSLADQPVLQHRVAELTIDYYRTRSLVYHAGHLGDVGDAEALSHVMAAKVAASESAVRIANEAMTLCGGRAYRENAALPRLLRDARAAHVMSPTTDLLKTWIGRTELDLPML